MADTSITTRTLMYRDPTVAAAAEAQLRRTRQQSFDSLVNQAQKTAEATARAGGDKGQNFQAAQEAAEQADQTILAEENPIAQRQARRPGLSAANGTGNQHRKVDEEDGLEETESGQAEASPPAVTFSAQQIAQERLGIGLHVPPLQPADEAYRKAGAEPPLQTEEDVMPSLFALAI